MMYAEFEIPSEIPMCENNQFGHHVTVFEYFPRVGALPSFFLDVS